MSFQNIQPADNCIGYQEPGGQLTHIPIPPDASNLTVYQWLAWALAAKTTKRK